MGNLTPSPGWIGTLRKVCGNTPHLSYSAEKERACCFEEKKIVNKLNYLIYLFWFVTNYEFFKVLKNNINLGMMKHIEDQLNMKTLQCQLHEPLRN